MHEKWPNKPWERLKLVVPTNAGFHKNFSCVSHTGIYYKLLCREKKNLKQHPTPEERNAQHKNPLKTNSPTMKQVAPYCKFRPCI